MLKPIVVTQSRLKDYVIASSEISFDSTTLSLAANGTMTDLLRKQGIGHLRTYSTGGLATTSFRGTGGSHTAFLWNGISITSPLSGQLDLSLIPAGIFDAVQIQNGGSSSIAGNGSIGATLHLDNNSTFNQGTNISVGSLIGSFGAFVNHASLRLGRKRFTSSTKLFVSEAENNFRFINRNFSPSRDQRWEHSASKMAGVVQQLDLATMSFGIFSLKLWYQKSTNEIPNPATITRASQAVEKNAGYRNLLSWEYSKNNLEFSYQGAYLRHDLNYADPVRDEYSTSISHTVQNNVEARYSFGEHTHATGGVSYMWEQGSVEAFGSNKPVRNRVAVFSAIKFEPFKKLLLGLSAREEFVDGKAVPFTPTVSIKFAPTKTIAVFSNLSRNYRLPTFNDLFWTGSGSHGNPLLKPELSLGGEFGVNIIKHFGSAKVAAFSNHVDNWILWLPDAGQAYVPQNIKQVWARGLEADLSYFKTFDAITVLAGCRYTFSSSTNERVAENGNPNEKGKQLILTPKHEGNITGQVTWKKYVFRVVESFTGSQFNDSDNSPYNIVPAYAITNLWVSKTLTKNNFQFSLTAEVNNLLNVEYHARPGYPLPGINYRAGLQITLNKQTKI